MPQIGSASNAQAIFWRYWCRLKIEIWHTCFTSPTYQPVTDCFFFFGRYVFLHYLVYLGLKTRSNEFLLSFFLLVNLHLIGRKVNYQAGIFKANPKTPTSTNLFGLLRLDFNTPSIQFRSSSIWTWLVPRNRSGPCKFVRCRQPLQGPLQGRKASIARGRTTTAIAARPPKALSTA